MPCRAKDCTFDHDKHFCAACGDKDSEHCLKDCPERHRMTLFHGTHKDNMDTILADGLRESDDGNLGKGVYFVHNFEVATNIAKRMDKESWAVIECKVDLGKCRSLYETSEPDVAGNWRTSYDSVFRRHPPWKGVWERHFREFNVKQAKIKVMQAKYEDEHGELASKKPPLFTRQFLAKMLPSFLAQSRLWEVCEPTRTGADWLLLKNLKIFKRAVVSRGILLEALYGFLPERWTTWNNKARILREILRALGWESDCWRSRWKLGKAPWKEVGYGPI